MKPFALEQYLGAREFSARHLLSVSDCDALSMQNVVASMDPQVAALWANLGLGYTESSGHPLLREEIANLYREANAGDIVVGAPEECIYLAMRTLVSAGDHVVCTKPGYQSLYEIALTIGADVSYWMPEAQGDRYFFDPDRLAGLIRPDTRLVVVNFPHNPTGAQPTPDEWAAISALTAPRGIRLFSDEMYRFLELDAERLTPATDLDPTAVTLFGMSKAFGLPGLRIGWLSTRDPDLMTKLRQYKDYTTICSSAPSEILALAALRRRDEISGACVARIRDNLQLLRSHPQLGHLFVPSGGTVCLTELPRGSAEALAERAFTELGLVMVPATVFDYGDRHIRVGLGRSSFPEALAELTPERMAAWL